MAWIFIRIIYNGMKLTKILWLSKRKHNVMVVKINKINKRITATCRKYSAFNSEKSIYQSIYLWLRPLMDTGCSTDGGL